jgi:hypothetical protein
MPAAPPQPRRRPPAEFEQVPEEAAYEEEERPRPRKMKNRARMQRANLGLGFHYGKVLCFLLFFLILLIMDLVIRFAASGAQVSVASGNRAAAAGFVSFLLAIMGILFVLMMIISLVTPVLGFVGSLLCLWVPQKTGTKPLIIASFSLDCASSGLMLLSGIMLLSAGLGSVSGGSPFALVTAGAGGILFLLSPLMAFAAYVLFMLFLRKLAYYLDDDSTGDEAISVMILTIAVGLGGVITFVVLAIALANTGIGGRIVLSLLSLAWMIAMIKILFRTLALIATLRAKLNSRYG